MLGTLYVVISSSKEEDYQKVKEELLEIYPDFSVSPYKESQMEKDAVEFFATCQITKEKARRAENLRLSRIASIGKLRKEIALNRTFKEKVLDYHKTVHIPFVPDSGWCGFNRVVHGGLIAAVLDEAMAWVVHEKMGDWAFTVDFHLRYKKAVEPGKEYHAVAGVLEIGRKITTEAKLYDPEGKLAAVADAVFLPGKGAARQQAG